MYFKKHFAAFKFDSPRTYLNSFALEGVSITGQHKKWLRDIKATVWERVEFKDELPPSWEALWRHWLRSCWVSHHWSQAIQNQYSVLKVTDYGWKLNGDRLEIDWDSRKTWNKSEIVFTIYSKDVGAKQVATTSAAPVLKMEGTACGPGCSCCNCENTQYMTISSEMEVVEEEVQEDNIVREDYRQLEEEDFSDTEEQEEDEEDNEQEEDEEDNDDNDLY